MEPLNSCIFRAAIRVAPFFRQARHPPHDLLQKIQKFLSNIGSQSTVMVWKEHDEHAYRTFLWRAIGLVSSVAVRSCRFWFQCVLGISDKMPMAKECVKLSAINLVSFREEIVDANRRRPGRVRCERLRCSHGEVVDLSVTGARLRLKGLFPPHKGYKREVVFETFMGPSLPFSCRVMWVKRVGLMRYEVGVEFVGLDDARHAQLTEMSRAHAGRTSIDPYSLAA